MIRRRSRRGFSVVEVIIAASLAIGLGLVVATAISSSSASSKNAISRAAAAEEVRGINDVVARYVRGAVRKPKCTLPANATTFSSCLVPDEDGETLQAASPSSITMLVYPDGANISGANAPAPEKIVVRTEEAAGRSVSLLVETYVPTNGFYDAAYPSSPTEVLRQVVLIPPKLAGLCTQSFRPALEVFSFLDDDGLPVTALTTPQDLAKVSVVKFDPQVRVLVQGESCPRIISSPVFLTLPVRGFGR